MLCVVCFLELEVDDVSIFVLAVGYDNGDVVNCVFIDVELISVFVFGIREQFVLMFGYDGVNFVDFCCQIKNGIFCVGRLCFFFDVVVGEGDDNIGFFSFYFWNGFFCGFYNVFDLNVVFKIFFILCYDLGRNKVDVVDFYLMFFVVFICNGFFFYDIRCIVVFVV